jgi:hypothetical protein
MARIRTTMLVRGLEGEIARMRATTARQKAAILDVMDRSGERVRQDVEDHCPIDEGLMVSNVRLVKTRGGYNNAVGFFARDFVGKRRPVSGSVVTFFYPRAVIRGTRRRAGNNILTFAELRERPRRRAALRRALAR